MTAPTAAELLWKAARVLTAISDQDAAIFTPDMMLRLAEMVAGLAEELDEFADRMVHTATYATEPDP